MRDFIGNCSGADGDFVFSCFVTAWCVDDEVDLFVFHHVHDVWSFLFS